MEKSKLIPKEHTDGPAPAPVEAPVLTTHIEVPVVKALSIPLDVANAIQREAERDPSDPFLARRLAAHYRSGIWTPADARK
jgi:hypothetical protein